MIRLQRKGVKKPKDWKSRVEAALPTAFWKKARAFEKLAEQGVIRKKGFVAYAPDALPKNAKGECEFPAVWRTRNEVRQAIAGMSHGSCAYCQSAVSSNHPGKGGKKRPPGQIEHFKPKSRFPTHAYRIDNYFLACSACNTAKQDKWPASGYVRPDKGQPGRRFVFAKTGKMKAARATDKQADATIKDIGLDRYWLNYHRKIAIRTRLALVKTIVHVASLKLEQLLVSEQTPFSEAINQNVRRVWAQARGRRA